MKAYFLSDIHLSSAKEPNASVFRRLLQQVREQKSANPQQEFSVFLLGDIFDLWVSDHVYFKRKFQTVWEPLRELKEAGVAVHYFEGNHDLYLKSFFGEFLGLYVHRGPEYFELNGKTVRVEHGDQMDPDDKGYLFLRWFLRTPLMEFTAPRLPDALVVKIGERASAASRDYTSNRKTATAEQIFEKIRIHVRKAYKEKPFDYFISGHVHVLFDELLDIDGRAVRAINLGTWMEQPILFHMAPSEQRFGDPRENL